MKKAFGIGFSKTGTKTLAECLRLIGYAHSDGDPSLLEEVMRGDLRRMFEKAERYESFDEWPWARMYKELDQRYPQAKFILTVRKDSKTWLRSVVKQAEQPAALRLLGRSGPAENAKRIHLLYRAEGLQVHRRRRKRIAAAQRKPLPSRAIPTRNGRWTSCRTRSEADAH